MILIRKYVIILTMQSVVLTRKLVLCYLGNNCRNILCSFQHKSLEKKNDEVNQEHVDGKTSENIHEKRNRLRMKTGKI